jgi:hypothetical protein
MAEAKVASMKASRSSMKPCARSGHIGEDVAQDLLLAPALEASVHGLMGRWHCGSMCHCAPLLRIHSRIEHVERRHRRATRAAFGDVTFAHGGESDSVYGIAIEDVFGRLEVMCMSLVCVPKRVRSEQEHHRGARGEVEVKLASHHYKKD